MLTIPLVLMGCGGGSSNAGSGSSSSSSSGGANATPPTLAAPATLSVNDGFAGPFQVAVGTVAPGKVALWSLGGADAARFQINASSGAISFASTPNYSAPADANADNEYRVTLNISDGTSSVAAPLAVQVLPWTQGGVARLPEPPLQTAMVRPTGSTANLRVLDWAGFRSALSYSFDDSSPSHIENWPALKAQNVRLTFYVNPTANWFPGYDNTFRDVIAQGHEIGNHTFHHCRAAQLGGADLTNCPNGFADAGAEFDQTTTYIVNTLGQSAVWTSAYPFGDTDYRPASSTRFLLSRGVPWGMVGPNDATDPHNLPIIGHAGDPTVPGGDPVSVFNADVDSGRSQGKWVIFLFHTVLPTTSNWGGGENVNMIADNMRHAKQAGDVWLDSVVNVGAYWMGQKLLSAVTPTTSGGVTTWSWALPANFPPGRRLRVRVDGGTLTQNGVSLEWNTRGYYEVSLDAQTLSWAP